MNRYFPKGFRWKDACKWNESFKNTGRNKLTLSLGYEVGIYIPYSTFQAMDKEDGDIKKVSQFINHIAEAYECLLK